MYEHNAKTFSLLQLSLTFRHHSNWSCKSSTGYWVYSKIKCFYGSIITILNSQSLVVVSLHRTGLFSAFRKAEMPIHWREVKVSFWIEQSNLLGAFIMHAKWMVEELWWRNCTTFIGYVYSETYCVVHFKVWRQKKNKKVLRHKQGTLLVLAFNRIEDNLFGD